MPWVPKAALGFVALLAATGSALAGEADVIAATATQNAGGTWTVSATIRHADTGWEHYADRFDVLTPEGEVLAERVLLHPHVEEQPFTRSVTATIPDDVTRIIVRAHDNVDGLGGAEVEVELER